MQNPFDNNNYNLTRILATNKDLVEFSYESRAEIIAKQIYNQVITFQNSLSNTDDILLTLVSPSSNIALWVDEIGYIGYTLILFRGKDISGNKAELIQNIHQVNFYLSSCPKPEPERPKNPIGFVCET